MTERAATAHVSAMDLDLHQLGDLPPERTAALLSHLAECESCRARQAEVQEAYGEFSAEVFPRTAPRLRERPQPKVAAIPRRVFLWAPALAAAAAVLLFVKVGVFTGKPSEDAGVLGVKGAVALTLSARRAGQPLAVDSKVARLQPGDEVRFVVTSGSDTHRYLLIASVDGAGTFSVYYPFDGEKSGAFPQPGRFEVPDSVVLDDTLGREQVHAFLSPEPLEAAQVKALLLGSGNAATVSSFPGADVESLVIEKQPAP